MGLKYYKGCESLINGKIIAVRTNKTVYRDGDRCIKLFGEGYSKAGVFSEALNLAYAEETGLNVPKVIDVTRIDGKWAIVTEFIEGKSLNQLMEENPDKTGEYMELFTRLHIELGKKTPRLTVLIRIAEALEVATDWILRAETPGTYAVANEKIGDLLEDCTSAEMQDFLRVLEDVKRAVRRKK